MSPSLVLHLSRRDFGDRYSGSLFGSMWAVIQPLVMILIYTVIFSQVMGARLPQTAGRFSYGVYLVAGIVPWMAFANTVTRSTSIFSDRKAYLTKLPMPLDILPLTVVISETYTFLITMGLYLLFLLVTGDGCWSVGVLLVPLLYAGHQLVAYGIGLILATINVFIKDLKEAVVIVFQIWFWFTPIVYVRDILPEAFRSMLAWNPAVHVIEAYQGVFVAGQVPDLIVLAGCLGAGLAVTTLARWFLCKLERDVRDFL